MTIENIYTSYNVFIDNIFQGGDVIEYINIYSAGGGGGSVAWGDVTGKPTEFPPSAHTHGTGDIPGLTAYQLTSGMTLYQSTGNYLTTAMASNAGSNFVQANAAFNGTNISGTIASGGISLSVAPGGGGADGYNIIAAGGSTANTTGTIVFSNSNGVSFGLNGGTVTATVATNYLTTAAQSNHSHNFATTTTNGVNIVVGTTNSNGVTIGVPALLTTAQPVGAYLTTARASNDAIGLNTALTANGVSVTANSSGLSLNFPAFLTTAAQSNHSHNFATTTTNGSLIVVGTTNSAGATIGVPSFLTTAQPVGAYLTTARASNDAVGLNTAQSNVTWTVNSSGISLDGRGYAGTGTSATNASVTLNSNGLAISVGAGGGVTPVASASNGSFSFTTLNFSNANNVTFGTSAGSIITASVAAPGAAAENNWVNLLGANTSGNTTASGSTIGYSGINLTLSGTNGSQIAISAPATSSLSGTGLASVFVNGSTISIGVPGTTLSNFYAWPYGQISSSQQTNSQMSFRYFSLDDNVSFSRVDIPINVSIGSSATANTANIVFTSGAAIYSANGSTLNPIVGHTNSTTHTWASNNSNYSSVLGGRYASFPLATVLTPGEYWLGVHISTNNNSSIGTATTAIANTVSVFLGSFLTAQNFADFGQTTGVSSVGIIRMQGLASLSISNTTMTFQQSQITASGAQGMRGNILFMLRNV